MKKLLVAGTAALTLLSAFPIMAKNDDGRGFGFGFKTDVKADVHVSASAAVDAACMQGVAKERSRAYTEAFSAYSTSINTALKVRADAEVSAWAKVDAKERTVALGAAEKTFTSSYNNASGQLTKAKNAARMAYLKGWLNCRKNGSSSSTSSVSSTSSSVTSSTSSNNSSTVACGALSGKLTGAFTLTSPINDEGRKLSLTGAGTVNDKSVEMSGSIQGLGFIAMGRANGDITIKQGTEGTLVLHLEGPVQTGFASLPKSYSYTVKSATGVFASVATSGKVELQLKGDLNGSFNMELGGKCAR